MQNFIFLANSQAAPINDAGLQGRIPTVGNPAGLSDIDLTGHGWSRIEVMADPAYDPATQYLGAAVNVEVTPGVWQRTRPVHRYTQVELSARVAGNRQSMVAHIRTEAQRRIITHVGATSFNDCLIREMNMLMRVGELQEIRLGGGALTAAEQVEAGALKSAAAGIKAIRAKSNSLGTSVAAMTAAKLSAFDPTANIHWV